MSKVAELKAFEEANELPSFNKNWFTPISKEEYKQKNRALSVSGKPKKIWKDILKRFFKNGWNVLFLAIFVILIVIVLIGSTFSSYSPDKPVSNAVISSIAYMPPSSGGSLASYTGTLKDIHVNVDTGIQYIAATDSLSWTGGHLQSAIPQGGGIWTISYSNSNYVPTILGTDAAGISVWQRLMASSKYSIGLAFIVASIETVIGSIVGLYLGYHAGKWIDTYFMRLVEIISSIPQILMIIILVLIFGHSFGSFMLALVIVGWVGPVYIARMFTMKIKDSEFINASISVGASQNRIIFKHILPNVFGRLLVSFVHRIPSVIFAEATLVFLGITLGGDFGNTLGNMLQQARILEALHGNPWFLISSASLLLVFTLSLQIIANGLRDAFDPKVSA